jgi:hypothetical protein
MPSTTVARDDARRLRPAGVALQQTRYQLLRVGAQVWTTRSAPARPSCCAHAEQGSDDRAERRRLKPRAPLRSQLSASSCVGRRAYSFRSNPRSGRTRIAPYERRTQSRSAALLTIPPNDPARLSPIAHQRAQSFPTQRTKSLIGWSPLTDMTFATTWLLQLDYDGWL